MVTIDEAIKALTSMREQSVLGGNTCLVVCLYASEMADSTVDSLALIEDSDGAVVQVLVTDHELRVDRKQEQNMSTLAVTSEIKLSRVAGLLCSAFEGGSNYWYRIEDFKVPANPVSHFEHETEVYRHIDYPLCPDGAVIVSDTEDPIEGEYEEDEDTGSRRQKFRTHVLDFEAVQRGLALMPTKAPRQWGRFLTEDDDADTGDAFLQCCLFGEVRYG